MLEIRLRTMAAVCAAAAVQIGTALPAQAASGDVAALLISDIHFDPFVSAGLPATLTDLPEAGWRDALLSASGAKPSFNCETDEPTATPALFEHALEEVRRHKVGFTVLSGDLLVHQFECRYRTLMPGRSAADYAEFAARTVSYVLSRVKAATGDRPVILALGNHDSGCGNYRRDAHDPFLARLAPTVAAAITPDPAQRAAIASSFAQTGTYTVAPLPGLPGTRALVFDTTPRSRSGLDCHGGPVSEGDDAPRWLEAQLAEAAQAGEHVWVVGHIPPGIDSRETILGKGAAPVAWYQRDEAVEKAFAAHRSVIRLALFGHTHMDEWRLVGGVPTKIVPAVTPSSGNNPAFTLAWVSPGGALADYTVMASTTPDGAGPWVASYRFSTAYGQAGFNASALQAIDRRFARSTAASAASSRYRNSYRVMHLKGSLLEPDENWPKYVCSITNNTAQNYLTCTSEHLNSIGVAGKGD